MPSRLTDERCVAIAQAYCSNGFNKTNGLRFIKNEDGTQFYSDAYCLGLGHRLYDNIRVKTEIDRIQAETQAKNEHNYEIAIAELNQVIDNLRTKAKNGDIGANTALTAAIREKNAITGLHKQEITHKGEPAPDLTEAERKAYEEAARSLKIRLASTA